MRTAEQKAKHALWMRDRYHKCDRLRCLIYQQLLRLAFPTEYRARSRQQKAKAYRLHGDRIRAYKRARYLLFPTQALLYCRKRQALLKGASYDDPKGIARIYQRAKVLRSWFNVVVDHIIPLSRGGAHSPDNLQIIYHNENARKSAKLGFQPSVVFS